MDLGERIGRIALREKFNSLVSFDMKEWSNLLELFDNFSKNYSSQIYSTISNGTVPSSSATEAMLQVMGLAQKLSNEIRGQYTNGQVLQISENINFIRDTYDTVFAAFSLTGVSNTEGFSTVHTYDEYIIPLGHSIAKVAEDTLGSRDKLQILLEDNPELIGLEQNELNFRKVKVRNDSKRGASLSANDGDESWGHDLPVSLEIEDGDLKVLTPKDTILQGVVNILLHGTHSVPEDRLFGNPVIDNIGQDLVSLSPAITIKTLKDTLASDPSVSSAEIQKFVTDGDKVDVKIIITPINSEESIDIIL